MASIAKRSTGYLVQILVDGERKSITFTNDYSRSDVEEFARYVDKCIFAMRNETIPDKKTMSWIEGLPKPIKKKLERLGLIEIEKEYTLQALFNEFLASADFLSLKKSTQHVKQHSYAIILEYFNPETKIDSISKNDARLFSEWLNDKFAPATKATIVRDLKRVFNWAIGLELVSENPFSKLKKGSYKNKSREHYVSMEDYRLILANCQTQEERIALALYRIGGLRKAEAFILSWSDVDFDRGKILVHSPKTERFKDQDTRTIPLFAQLRAELEPAYKRGMKGRILHENEGAIYFRFKRAINKAGLEVWDRLIQNLRSSRAIDVYRKYGSLAEKEWIGHTEQTARAHYLHLLEEDFQNAAEED
ncbi:MAG: tyrosine-type recombinase/integrase [Thermoguttaceae bacterium]|nr:tyrosine-type recombinase/integrase [Thermoguttaceae bacterium]